MSATVRIPLHEEMDAASRVAAALIAAGIDPDDEHYADLMASETDIQDRLVRILRAARYTEAQSEALAAIVKDNRDRKARLDSKAERLRNVVMQAMADLGLKRLEAPDLSATAGISRSKVVVTDEARIPSTYFVTSRNLDKRALAAALSEAPVPGAEMSNGEPSLTVRVR